MLKVKISEMADLNLEQKMFLSTLKMIVISIQNCQATNILLHVN